VEDGAFVPICEVAFVIWNVFFNRFGLSWVMSKCVVNLYACWRTTGNIRSCCVEVETVVHLLIYVEVAREL
jgi:hypothetical protein